MQFFLQKCSLRIQIVATGLLEKSSVIQLWNTFFPLQLIPMGLCLARGPFQDSLKEKGIQPTWTYLHCPTSLMLLLRLSPAQPAELLGSDKPSLCLGKPHPGSGQKTGLS